MLFVKEELNTTPISSVSNGVSLHSLGRFLHFKLHSRFRLAWPSVLKLPVTVKTFLKELTKRSIRYSYLVYDSQVDKIAHRLESIRQGSKELTTVVLADFSVFKAVLDGMYAQNKLSSDVTYMIVNDGWESTNPEIEFPQTVNYSIDMQLLLLKRQIGDDISAALNNITKDIRGEKWPLKWKVSCSFSSKV
ncbi:glutamate receptor ionotropic, delta-1 [Trichonephila clavipes]|nr:glutamate receptor ionotropic, delta-1 [Trichonephila clavipes]